MSARHRRPLTFLASIMALAVAVALIVLNGQSVAAAFGLTDGTTRYLTFTVNRTAVPAWVLNRELTLRVKVGAVSSVVVSADGRTLPATYDPISGKVMFTSDASPISLVLYNSTSDPATIGQIAVPVLRGDKRWAFSMTFDDGYSSQYEYATTYLEKYGWTGGISFNGRSLDDPFAMGKSFINDAQMRDLFARGWGIFNHSYSHYYVSQFANTTAALNDVKRGSDRIAAGGVPSPTVFVAPYVDPAYWDIVRTNNVAAGIYLYQGSGNPIPIMESLSLNTTNFLGIGREGVVHVDPLVDLTHQKALASPASHFWLLLSTHTIDSGCDPVETTMDYVYDTYGAGGSDEVWVAPLDRVYGYWMTRQKSIVPATASTNATSPVIVDSRPSPAWVLPDSGAQVTLTVRVADPQGPGNIASVQSNLSAVGQSAATVLFDDGAHGDGAAADGVFGVFFTVAPGIATGSKVLPVTVNDADGHSASSSAVLTVTTSLPPAPTPMPSPTPAIGPINALTVRQGLNGYSGASDTTISAASPTTNFATQGSVNVDNRGFSLWRSMIKYDLTSLGLPPYAVVTKATINVYLVNQSNDRGNCLNVYEMTQSWTENQANWNVRRTGVNWAVPGADDPTDHATNITGNRSLLMGLNLWRTINITDLAQKWIADPATNNGVYFLATGVQGVQSQLFSSNYGNATLRPYLQIQYALPLDVPTATATATPTSTRTATASPTSIGTATNTGTPTNTGTVTPTPSTTLTPSVTPTPTDTPATPPYQRRANSGGALYSSGVIWDADQAYSYGGWGYVGGSTYSTVAAITATSDPTLYRSEHWWSGNGSYRFDLPNGQYTVTLKFDEIYYTMSGQRVFDVRLEGVTVLSSFDPYAAAGAKNKAVDRVFVATVNDGQLTIDFITRTGGPKVNAIAVESVGPSVPTATLTPAATGTITQTPTISPTPSETGTPTQTSTPGPTWTPTSTPTVTQTRAAALYQKAVNVGGPLYVDGAGMSWLADQPYAVGGWGYVNPAPPVLSSLTYANTHAIAGAADGKVYQTERFSLAAYRFTAPNGTYSVVLKFAEIYPYTQATKRVFDVRIEGTTVLSALDVMASAGLWHALDYTFMATVTDGVLSIDFTPRVGYPKINAIMVTYVGP